MERGYLEIEWDTRRRPRKHEDDTYKPRRRPGRAPSVTALRRNEPGRPGAPSNPLHGVVHSKPAQRTVHFPCSSILSHQEKALHVTCWVEVILVDPIFYHLCFSNIWHNILQLFLNMFLSTTRLWALGPKDLVLLTFTFGTPMIYKVPKLAKDKEIRKEGRRNIFV